MEKIFLIQGHPEYNPDFVINRAAPFFVKMMTRVLLLFKLVIFKYLTVQIYNH